MYLISSKYTLKLVLGSHFPNSALNQQTTLNWIFLFLYNFNILSNSTAVLTTTRKLFWESLMKNLTVHFSNHCYCIWYVYHRNIEFILNISILLPYYSVIYYSYHLIINDEVHSTPSCYLHAAHFFPIYVYIFIVL